jgi:hypothetical protein
MAGIEPRRSLSDPYKIQTGVCSSRTWSDAESPDRTPDKTIAALDPKICAAIGGRVHVATVTPTEGLGGFVRRNDAGRRPVSGLKARVSACLSAARNGEAK